MAYNPIESYQPTKWSELEALEERFNYAQVWERAAVMLADTVNKSLDALEKHKDISKTIHIKNLRSDKYELTQTIPIELEFRENNVVATSYDIDTYGVGDTEQDAIGDLCGSIVELYEALQEDKDRLGPYPVQQFSYLNTILQKRGN